MDPLYHIVVNGKAVGPMTREELKNRNISRDTYVWREGLTEWVAADKLPELSDLFVIEVSQPPHLHEETVEVETAEWFAMLGGNYRVGPTTVSDLVAAGLTPQTPVWRYGMADWIPAYDVAEIMEVLNRKQHHDNAGPDFGANPQYDTSSNPYGGNINGGGMPPYDNPYSPRNPYGQEPPGPYGSRNDHYHRGQHHGGNYPGEHYPHQHYDPYGQPYRTAPTNWLPWAIVATILGIAFYLIGCIFGIIGIVQANKANNLFASGNQEEALRVNANARTLTIIGLVIGGIGALVNWVF